MKNFLVASSGTHIFAQNSPVEGREIRDASRLFQKSPQNPVPSAKLFRHKPQIVSIPGISPKERNRYRVTLGGQVLGEMLSINEAVEMAKRGGRDG